MSEKESRRNTIIKFKVLILVLLGTLFSCAQNQQINYNYQDWNDTCYSDFDNHLKQIAGSEVKDCGLFGIEWRSEKITNEQRKSIDCIKQAINDNSGFRYGYSGIPIDSFVCMVVIQDNKGKVWSVTFDNDITGQMGIGENSKPVIWLKECEKIKFDGLYIDTINCKQRNDIVKELLK